jgi:hypothetical protein
VYRAILVAVLAACGAEPAKPTPISNRTTPELRPRPEDKGAIQGIVADAKTGEPLAGVTVVGVSPTAPHVETAITDEHGAYKLRIPPGEWVVSFYYADITAVRRGIHVGVNAITPVSTRLRGN